jgi:TolB-like protein/Tfp pilus assembly protein PilF
VAEGPSNGGDGPVAGSDRGERLDSWKEIAGHLKRHVTTVQRWERLEGLPVHRHLHDKLGSVYAYTSELDDWWRNRAQKVEPDEPGAEAPPLTADLDDPEDTKTALPGWFDLRRLLPWQVGSARFVLAACVLAALAGLLFSGGAGRDPRHDGSARIQAVAILPLANLSLDPDQEYFAEGMTEALITELAKIQSLTVISRTSVMRYKGATKALREIARELDVEGVVQGAVVRSGRRVRITAQLVDVRSDRHLWAETYERDLHDVLALQGEVARAIAGAVQATLTLQERTHLTSTRSLNVEAYDAYLMGRYLWNKRTAVGFQKAVEYFQTAIAKDPKYAAAYAGLADCYLAGGREDQPKHVIDAARAAALKALEIAPDLAEARSALAGVKLRYDFDWRGAEEEHQRAIASNANYATAHLRYSQYLSFRRRFDEALREARRAEQLDPFSVVVRKNTAFVLYWARQYDEALKQYRRVLEMEPTFPQALREIGLVYEQQGMFPQSIAALQEALRLPGNYFPTTTTADLGHVHAVSGSERQARNILSELHELSRERYVSAFDIAVLHAGLGDTVEALAWLEKAFDERSFFLVSLNIDPRFDHLRAEPRFRALVQRVGLTTS